MRALKNTEIDLLLCAGWSKQRTDDGVEFCASFGSRTVKMAPTLRQKQSPMIFRTQAQLYDAAYSEVSVNLGWGEDPGKPLWWTTPSNQLDQFDIEAFDATFVTFLTGKLQEWAESTDAQEILMHRLEQLRTPFIDLSALIDMAFLAQTNRLQALLLDFEKGEQSNLLLDQPIETVLSNAIDISLTRS